MKHILWLFLLGSSILSIAQTNKDQAQIPLDDFVVREGKGQPWVIPYPQLREADLLWEKRIWRVIDTREKMNLLFRYPQLPLIKIFNDAILSGEIKAYHPVDDKFTALLPKEELRQLLNKQDTVEIMDPETYEVFFKIAENEFDPESVKRYRVKEVWYFDTRYSQLKVRILGVAPLREVFDDQGNFLYETPLYWIYYPQARNLLARHAIFNPQNDKKVLSWEDLWEMRYFSSTITKESNIHDRRLQDYLSGVALLQEADKIKQEIFNFEHDLWTY